jgi:alpha-D-ribose 1-methylphosphonate 5-triphosphate diphosphatase
MHQFSITNGRVLLPGQGFAATALGIAGGEITAATGGRSLDASGCLVLPGIVDIHGDAFERQMQPRPGVDFPLEMALMETDRQVVANGITTVFHGVTWSWEPGLRSGANALALLEGMERLRPRLAADTRYHLRHEPYNLPAEETIMGWLAAGRLGCIAYNDHLPDILKKRDTPRGLAKHVERSGIGEAEFSALLEEVAGRREAVRPSIERLAAAARASGTPQLSHDDDSAEQRRWYRGLGARIAEFPETDDACEEARSNGDPAVFGAPNVVRGGSHCGAVGAAEMVRRGIGTILASDYFYPAILQAPFRLAVDGVQPLEQAWDQVSLNPARALGLADRGALTPGLRADVIVVEAPEQGTPRVVATIAAGRIVHLADGARLG